MSTLPLLVGICGHAGVGKDTFAEQLAFYGFRQYSFAGPVKKVCEAAFCFTPEDFTDRARKEEESPYWGKSPREAAQIVGTELFRNAFGADFWINRLQLQLILDFPHKSDIQAVISDVRFQNEAQWVLDSGGILVHLTRPGYAGKVGIHGHASEAGIDFSALKKEDLCSRIYHIENDASKSQLQEKADKFAVKLIWPAVKILSYP